MQVSTVNSFIPVISPSSKAHSTKVSSVEAWISDNHKDVMEKLKTSGALLFRGFEVHTAQDFERIGLAVIPLATRYPGGAPREKLADHVWTASETPGKMPISSHCELSYIPNLRPDQILFCCLSEPDEGGETPIANMHDVWDSLPKDLQERILSHDFEVVRQYPECKRRMLDVRRLAAPTTAWPDVLGSLDPVVVDSDAKKDGVTLNFWQGGGKPPVLCSGRLLGTVLGVVLLAVALGKMLSAMLGPVLGTMLAVAFMMSPPVFLLLMKFLTPWPLVEMQEKLVDGRSDLAGLDVSKACVELVSTFPGSREVNGRTAYGGVDVFFSEYGWAAEASFVAMRTRRLIHAYIAFRIAVGTIVFTVLRCLGLIGRAPLDLRMQGQSLSLQDVVCIEQAYWSNFEFLKWQKGDVLILNNELCSHGRMPFEGKRRVLTAFG